MAHDDEGRQTVIWRRFDGPVIQGGLSDHEDTLLRVTAPIKSALYREHPVVGVLVLDALQHCRGAS